MQKHALYLGKISLTEDVSVSAYHVLPLPRMGGKHQQNMSLKYEQ